MYKKIIHFTLSNSIFMHVLYFIFILSEFESRINKNGNEDPLEAWFEYISWVEQCFPKSGKEGGIDELLEKCLKTFANETRYFQDKRMVQLYIKYVGLCFFIYFKFIFY